MSGRKSAVATARVVAVVAALAAALLGFAVSAPAAQAADTKIPIGTISCDTGASTEDLGAFACFKATGEHLYICDTAPDGHHPAVHYKINNGSWSSLLHYDLGSGYCHDINLDLPEADTVWFQAFNYEGTTQWSHSPVVYAFARG
jgi:hypothetical protein